MKRILTLITAMALLLGMAGAAVAEAPAQGSWNPVAEEVRGNDAFQAGSVPEIWITPIYAEYIIGQDNPEKYPSRYVTFAPREGTTCMALRYDQIDYIDHDKLALYAYYAAERASYELFLEKADEAHILLDGQGGVAMYIDPERGYGYAMIDMKPMFGGTAKLGIIINAYYMKPKEDELKQLIEEETARVQGSMQVVELDHYWSEGVFSSVTIKDDSNPVSATVDLTGLAVTKLEADEVEIASSVKQGTVKKVKIALDDYSYPHSKAEDGDAAATDEALQGGTEYKSYTSDYLCYASFTMLESGKYDRPVYLTIQIDTTPDEFRDELEAVYAWIKTEVN